MSKKKLYFDLDGVLYPWQEQMLQHLTLCCGYIGTMEDLFCGPDCWFNTHNKLYEYNMIRIETLYETRPPTKQLIDKLNDFKERFEIGYITQRPEDIRRVTERYLRNYKFPSNENLIMTDNKSDSIRMIECDYYVEDCGDVAETLDKLTKVFLYKQLWNGQFRNMFTTIGSIYELEDAINEFERNN